MRGKLIRRKLGTDVFSTAKLRLGDARGAVLVATSGLDLRIISETGEGLEIPGTACPDPLRPVAFGKGLAVASCRSGLLFGVSDKGR